MTERSRCLKREFCALKADDCLRSIFDIRLPGGSPRVQRLVSTVWRESQISGGSDLRARVKRYEASFGRYPNIVRVDKGFFYKAESTFSETHPPACA